MMPLPGPTDAQLATAAATGDRQALAAIFDRYGPRVYAFCRSMLHRPADADDCLQDVFVIAATRLGGLREPDRLRSWLFSVARHECLHRLDRSRREMPVEEVPDTVDRHAESPATAVITSELGSLIADALAGLTDRDRLVIELVDRQGLSTEELGAALSMTGPSAHKLLTRARATARASIGSLLLARTSRQNCSELDAILGTWDGRLNPLLRKRIARHVQSCRTCADQEQRVASPAALLRAFPVFLLPLPWMLGGGAGAAGAAAAGSAGAGSAGAIGSVAGGVPAALRSRVLDSAGQAQPAGGAAGSAPGASASSSDWSRGWPGRDVAMATAPMAAAGPVAAAAAVVAVALTVFLVFRFGGDDVVAGGSVPVPLALGTTDVITVPSTPPPASSGSTATAAGPSTALPSVATSSTARSPVTPGTTGALSVVPSGSGTGASAIGPPPTTVATDPPGTDSVGDPVITVMTVACEPAPSVRDPSDGYVPVLRWETAGATGISVSIDHPDTEEEYGDYYVYGSYGPSGFLQLPPNGCYPVYGTQVYTVYAHGFNGADVDRTIIWEPPADLAPTVTGATATTPVTTTPSTTPTTTPTSGDTPTAPLPSVDPKTEAPATSTSGMTADVPPTTADGPAYPTGVRPTLALPTTSSPPPVIIG